MSRDYSLLFIVAFYIVIPISKTLENNSTIKHDHGSID